MEEKTTYLDFLAKMGIGNAHPGGRALTEAILTKFPISKGEKVLDVGCGTGETSAYLFEKTKCDLTAIDLHPKMIEQAKARARQHGDPYQVMQANAEALPFSDGSFHRIFSESVTAFTHIPKALKEYYRVLSPQGSITAIEMTTEQKISPLEIEDIKSLYGVSQVLTEREWCEYFYKANFSEVIGYKEEDFFNSDQTLNYEMPLKFTSDLDQETIEIWIHHLEMMDKYRDILSYRIYQVTK
ncbi:methyltransferase domain-containing protein [Terrilactibacillus sp. BCM23-1]|uniref:Methyltransferase domain-containing protein n=1 Tax=Terrilactibacillus tamarindi TaxID=2599694 RepID=A0A6N8CVD0_9BACI|nr:class I SAM-dependent methyltransferase [Terrilactibacillus tamarindi]MTT33185.1 methyltransferase domain-containing protein [Terrilactibacillus tamarindi]